MPFRRLILLSVLSLITWYLHAQQGWRGIIRDAHSGDPVPYATLRLSGKDVGMVANEDGRYFLPGSTFHKTDTILISCVGYSSNTIRLSDLSETGTINLYPVVYQLSEVKVTAKGQDDFLYRLFFDICQKYRNEDNEKSSKAYMLFMSSCQNQPLEMIEAYFNTVVSTSGGISSMLTKNGRIGLTLRNFWSLNTTDIFTNFAPFLTGGHSAIPPGPGNLGFHRLKNLYTIELLRYSKEPGSKQYVLKFIPRADTTGLCGAVAYVNGNDMTFDKIEYSLRDIDFYYLKAQIGLDRVDSLRLSLSAIFDNRNPGQPKISQFSIEYSFYYYEFIANRYTDISSGAELFFYDYDHPFLKTLGYPSNLQNDYQRIMVVPYDTVFWVLPEVTVQSLRQKKFIEYFRSNGILYNYPQQLNRFARSVYLPWTASRNLEYFELGNKPPPAKKTGTKRTEKPRPDIMGLILMNPVVSGDSIHLSSVCLVNARESYVFDIQNYRSTAYINLIFDLYELWRRKLVSVFCSSFNRDPAGWNQFREIYQKEMLSLQDTIRIFHNECWEGTEIDTMLKWYNNVSSRLGIDRSVLVKRMTDEEKSRKRRNTRK